jgi:hypothetical protein
MSAVVTQAASGQSEYAKFDAQMGFFDTFSDGRKITLNVEAQVIPRRAANAVFLLLLVSPGAKDAALWSTLREIGAQAVSVMTAKSD